MLQDLDARQNGSVEASHMYTKPESFGERGLSPFVVAGAALGVAVLAAGAAFGWRYWQKAHQPVAVAPVPAKVVIIPAPPKAAPPPPAAPIALAEPAVVATPAPAPAPEKKHERQKVTAEHKRDAVKANTKAEPKTAPADTAPEQGKEVTSAQKAESAYRRGLANIQEGYLADGIGALEQALQANPRHDAARQTLVRVLIDNKRSEEAIGLLQTGLTLDPRQPSMAMLLARLQIEHGGSGIETLTRTLPYVGANSEYHAFLAGALQRQQRHREAVEQYQAALRGAQNGVWLMGLGISLQAEKRDTEALDAFRKAKNSGNLSADLLAFVDSKIQQLVH
ncbi:hypothetical protein GCM10027321_00200 [Massilia terrae]